jgi:SAM-dependent methyltransferase
VSSADALRGELLAGWERSAKGWGEAADVVRDFGMPVSAWMVEALALQPGETVLELACGPGDTGFMAAELVAPGGKLISSDGTENMLAVARGRAEAMGIANVEFKQLQLEWIDMPTASVDAVMCRWGYMLIVDPDAAFSETRRVLKPGGRVALAVWGLADANPWATIPVATLIKLGHLEPPDATQPGMFALAADGDLQDRLRTAGFVEVGVETVALDRDRASLDAYMEETLKLARPFREVYERLDAAQQGEVRATIAEMAAPFTAPDGTIAFPARTLVALASA